jgi:hypothetical protein
MHPGRPHAVRRPVSVQEDHATHVRRPGPCQRTDDRRTTGVPDQDRRTAAGVPQPHRREERRQLGGVAGHGVRTAAFRVSEPADIEGVDPVAVAGQHRTDPVPDRGRLQESVDEHDRRPCITPLLVVRLDVAGAHPMTVRAQWWSGHRPSAGHVVTSRGDSDHHQRRDGGHDTPQAPPPHPAGCSAHSANLTASDVPLLADMGRSVSGMLEDKAFRLPLRHAGPVSDGGLLG